MEIKEYKYVGIEIENDLLAVGKPLKRLQIFIFVDFDFSY